MENKKNNKIIIITRQYQPCQPSCALQRRSTWVHWNILKITDYRQPINNYAGVVNSRILTGTLCKPRPLPPSHLSNALTGVWNLSAENGQVNKPGTAMYIEHLVLVFLIHTHVLFIYGTALNCIPIHLLPFGSYFAFVLLFFVHCVLCGCCKKTFPLQDHYISL